MNLRTYFLVIDLFFFLILLLLNKTHIFWGLCVRYNFPANTYLCTFFYLICIFANLWYDIYPYDLLTWNNSNITNINDWRTIFRRKKRCIRYIESGGDSGNQSDDNQSNGSLGHSDNEEADSVSSPGGLSALSSLTSPGMLTQASLSPATPLTPHVSEYECPIAVRMPLAVVVPTRHHQPVGTNPHDINNPLSVNQLTGGVNKCHPKEQSDMKTSVGQQQQQSEQHPNNRALPAISVT